MPRVYNLMNDPQELDNVIFPHTWVLKAGLPQLDEHAASLLANPPIKAGALDPYQPPTFFQAGLAIGAFFVHPLAFGQIVDARTARLRPCPGAS